jgi:hypothetical protein
MKTLKIVLACLVVLSSVKQLHAQKAKGYHHHRNNHGHRPGKVVVVKRSAFRPKKTVVFHPVWRPKFTYHRRWVFFPKYNLYWDNWRNHYLFWNGAVWVSQATAPAMVVNVNLENEKHNELKDSDDDTDDIYKYNEDHKTEYKAE